MSNVFAVTQAAFQFYADGTESGATSLAAQNTNITRVVDTLTVLRMRYDETGSGSASGATTDDYQLQVSKNAGAYANVTTSSANVKAVASANLTDQGATTQRLTAGGGSFVAGKISEDGLVDDWQLTANNHGELVYVIQLVGNDLATNDTLDFRTLRNGATMTYSVTPRITADLGTGARKFVSASTQYLTGNFQASNDTGDFTLACWYWIDSFSGFHTLLCFGPDDGNCIILNTGNTNFGGFVSGTSNANFESGVAPTTGQWRFVALRNSSGTVRIVEHGTENTTGGTVTGRAAMGTQTSVGGRRNDANTSGSQYFTGRIAHVAYWSRAVSNTDLNDMAANLKSPLWYDTNLVYYNKIAGSSPETPTTGTGDLTVTGATVIDGPDLTNPPKSIVADSGSYTFTGAAATLTKGYKIAADSGSFSEGGTATGLLGTFLVSAGSGTFDFTGTAATLTKALPIAANSGSFALTGSDVTFLRTYVVAADSGVYIMTGQDASLEENKFITAESGVFSVTGSTINMLYGRVMPANAGSYVVGTPQTTLVYGSPTNIGSMGLLGVG